MLITYIRGGSDPQLLLSVRYHKYYCKKRTEIQEGFKSSMLVQLTLLKSALVGAK